MILSLPWYGKVSNPAILTLDKGFGIGVFEYQGSGFGAEAIGCNEHVVGFLCAGGCGDGY